MHAALISSRATNMLIALLASLTLATAVAPMLEGHSFGPRSEPSIMPGSLCPPQC